MKMIKRIKKMTKAKLKYHINSIEFFITTCLINGTNEKIDELLERRRMYTKELEKRNGL